MLNLELLPFHNWLVDLRRELHQIPELGYKEGKTQAKICGVLDELGVPYKTGVGKTGVAARVKSNNAGPTVAFRADMDALPLEESNDTCYYVVSSPIRLKLLGLLRKTRKIHIGNVFNWLKD